MAGTIQSEGTPAGFGALQQFIGTVNLRQLILLIGLAASVAAGITAVLWLRGPDYQSLFASLPDQEAAAVAEALEAAGVDYRLDGRGGGVLVAADELYAARLKLAAEGLPRSSASGFDLLDEQPSFGVSQFMESARYQRAMELELARTIVGLAPVANARVHLALPKPSVFVRDARTASASVTVQLHAGRQLLAEQIGAITYLVASSVPDLEPGQVTVVDQQGVLLSGRQEDPLASASDRQFEQARRLESAYVRRIHDLLAPVVGAEAVRAQVDADLDFTAVEETRESFDPERSVLRSEQVDQSERRNLQPGEGGAPGALSNQPPEAGTLAPAGEQTPGERRETNSQTTRNYEVDKTVSHIRRPLGEVERLTVAVVVDDWRRMDADGNAVREPLAEAELQRLQQLVEQAVGFDAARGDRISVINQSFQSPELLEPLPEPSLLSRPWLRELMRQGLLALVLLVLGFAVVRPTLRSLTRGLPGLPTGDTPALPAPARRLEGPVATPAREMTFEGSGLSFDQKLQAVRSLASQDPGRVAQVVKSWVREDG